jgi:D-serine deaminase-like pyridoxal phosphate-dependent protein
MNYATLKTLFRDHTHPLLFVDERALESNIEWVLKQSGTKKIRIATKSVRSTAVLKKILAANPRFQGLMTYTLEESLWLSQQGFKDILIGYPTVDTNSLEQLAKSPQDITLMVDRVEHLEMLEAIAKKHNSTFNICIDLDLSMDLPGVRFGVYRSSIQEEKSLNTFLHLLKKCQHLKLKGVMGYEAQIAGVGDKNSLLMRILKKFSLKQLKKRRQHLMNVIKAAGFTPEIVNGGGTGSLHETSQENVVTEVTAGSAFFAPVLFDQYKDFTLSPAAAFTLPVVRKPSENIITVLGGGYIASGATELIKTPQPYLPEGLSLIKNEGAGEVQTPIVNNTSHKLQIGDFVVMRHAKAGEVCERFNEILLIKDNEIKKINTYRGDGKCFL